MEIIVLTFQPPEPGTVLPALIPTLSPQDAAALYNALMDDALEYTQEMGVRRMVGAHPNAAHPFFQALVKRVYIELADHAFSSPADRAKSALNVGFKKGAKKVAIWDTFTPTLSTKVFKDAFIRLDKADLVLGPSMDYGTYLIAAKEGGVKALENVNWGSPSELTQIIGNCENLRVPYSLLGTHVRLRTPNDLPFFMMNMRETLKSNSRVARHTRKILDQLNIR